MDELTLSQIMNDDDNMDDSTQSPDMFDPTQPTTQNVTQSSGVTTEEALSALSQE